MRTLILTFIFIISEYSIITGGDGNCGDPPEIENSENTRYTSNSTIRMYCKKGYERKPGTSNLFRCRDNKWKNNSPLVCIHIGNAEKAKHVTSSTFRMQCKEGYTRKAGTSNLFKCRDSKWANNPSLKCISLPGSTIPSAQASPTTKMPFMTTKNEESNFTTFGKTVFRITHTDYTTSPTSSQTSRRTTTTMRETTVTTSITTIITASSTTEKENRIRSLSTMSTGNSSTEFYSQSHNKTGIAVGTVIFLLACSATTAVVLLWRRRSRPRGADSPVQIRTPDHCTDQLLKKDQKKTESGSPDSIQLAVNPSKNSNEGV